MHAGNVKYGHPLQGQAAEVQWCSTALETEQQSQGIGPQTGHQIGSNAYVLGPAPPTHLDRETFTQLLAGSGDGF